MNDEIFHLSRIDLRTGDRVEPRAVVGLSGDSGIAPTPLLQWRTYLHVHVRRYVEVVRDELDEDLAHVVQIFE